MTGVRRGTGPLAAVALLAAAAVALALTRSASAAGVHGAEGCPAAQRLGPASRVAIVDSGIAPSALPAGSHVVERIDRSAGPYGVLDPHGTAMAWIVARGAPSARLIDVRVLDGDGAATTADLAEGIDAATDADADVINLSAAVPPGDLAIRRALHRAVARGVVVVVAAGNDHRDLGRDPAWRSLAAEPCLIVVGASDRSGVPLASSSYGRGVIDVWAVGDSVTAASPSGGPVHVTGTSPAVAATTATLLRAT